MTSPSREHPYYFLTFVTHHRLPVFRTEKYKFICCKAFAEAASSGKFKILAYVLMPDHAHLITNGEQPVEKILRFLKGVSARRIVDELKLQDAFSSLKKLQVGSKQRNYKYSVWQHNSNSRMIFDDAGFKARAHYIHENPLKERLVEAPDAYLFSSVRIWKGNPLETEPLNIDL